MTPAPHFTKFGKYEIIRKLGRSMTDVYLAADPENDRRVVLKIVEQCSDSYTSIVVEAERRGAAIQQQLHGLDSRVLEVYEFGEMNNCFFVAMQYVEGRSLAEVLQNERRLDPARAARYIAEVASQLVALHSFQVEIEGRRRAVVHGDIKPSNIQIGAADEVRLLDFGIAKYISETRHLTAHNLGSPAYCSPERLQKAQVDPQADLWALGVCLYESIAGMPPYQAQTTRKLENLIQSRRPPRALPDNCPAALRSIIWKALAADIAGRYATAEAFFADLDAFLNGRPTVAAAGIPATWDANATVQKSRPQPHQEEEERAPAFTRVRGFATRHSGALTALAAGLIVGVLLFGPISYFHRVWSQSAPLRTPRDFTHAAPGDINTDWALFQRLDKQNQFLGTLSPVTRYKAPLRANLLRAGRDVLDTYRNSSDPDLTHFEWDRARLCFSRVTEMDPGDREAKAGFALAAGYLHLAEPPMSPRAAESSFREAAALMPKSPDPHLALARLYASEIHNPGQAMAEMHAAQRLGFTPGPREFEQQGDAYRYRGEQQLAAIPRTASPETKRKLLALAQRDFGRARHLYEPISGYSNVNDGLAKLDRGEERLQYIEIASRKVKTVRPAASRKRYTARARRWR